MWDIYSAFADDRYKTIVMVCGAQMGKALATDTRIPTPGGWTTMGALKVGDVVFDERGRQCRVVFATDVMHGRECYRIEFSDGAEIIADAEHRWYVEPDRREPCVLTTAQLLGDYKYGGVNNRNRYAIPVAQPLDCADADLPIDPYVLGAWLGDGHSASSRIYCHADDAEHFATEFKKVGHSVITAHDRDNTVSVRVDPKRADVCPRGHLKDVTGWAGRGCAECGRVASANYARREMYGLPEVEHDPIVLTLPRLLSGLNLIRNKHIPDAYLRASKVQRMSLLQGLMDTDGHAGTNGRCEFVTTSDAIADGMRDLLASLGIKHTVKTKQPKTIYLGKKVDGAIAYRFSFLVYDDCNVFRLQRKAARLVSRVGRRTTETERRRIVGIHPVQSVPVRCIQVDSSSHLFLAGDAMIPTHNTEAVFNILGWSLDDRPLPCMYVGPTEKQVRSISSDRMMKMLKSTPSLWDKLEKGQRNKVSEKFIGGVRMGFAWAGSATELASHPVGLVLVDERDRMNNTDEGDPVTLSTARTKNYHKGKVGIFSTPTIEGASPIWSLFLEGTRHMWAFQCLHCDEFFVPKLDLLRWPEDSNPSEAAASATLACRHCGAEHTDADKHHLERRGKFIPHELTKTGDLKPLEVARPNVTASFWVSGLASPWQSFGDIARRMVAAYATNDQERIQAEINTYGGEVFRVQGDAPPWGDVLKLRLPYRRGDRPVGVQMITMGVDVQKFGLYYTVRGWGHMSESWLLDHGYIAGETEFDNVWISLHQVISQTFDGRPIQRVFIDSGFAADRVYAFVRRTGGAVYASKGQERMDKPLRTNVVDVSQKGKMIKAGVKLWHVNTDYFKSQVYARIRWPLDQPGGWHLHEDTDEDYCRQLVSESMMQKASGRRIWVRNYKDNHYLDCEVLAFAAASSLQVHALEPMPEQKAQPAKVNQPVHKPDKPFIKSPRNNWLRR